MFSPTFVPTGGFVTPAAARPPLLSTRTRKLPSQVPRRSRPHWHCALVAVAGATGGVGRLLVQRLLSTIPTESSSSSLPPSLRHLRVTAVRALVRSSTRAASTLPSSPNLDLCRISSIPTAPPDQLAAALRDVAVLVICTGTTAFPTRTWANGNTPSAIDDTGVYNLIRAVDKRCIKRVVLLSSIGTTRRNKFPFFILNAFGVLDAKRQGERHVLDAAREELFSYAIVRPGRLIGAPHSNIGMMREEPVESCLDVRIERGDTLTGDISRAAVADALSIVARWDPSKDLDICLFHREGMTPHFDKWELMLKRSETVRQVKGERMHGCIDV